MFWVKLEADQNLYIGTLQTAVSSIDAGAAQEKDYLAIYVQEVDWNAHTGSD